MRMAAHAGACSMPRVIALLIFLAHTVSALGTSVPPPPNQPQQACVSLKITTTTARWSKEQAWRIDDGSQGKNWTGSSTDSDDFACIGSIGAQLCEQPPLTKEFCLGIGNHSITLTDSWGDGWENGSHVKIERVDNGGPDPLPMVTLPPTDGARFGTDRTETFYVSLSSPPSPPPSPPSPPPSPPLPPDLPGARTFFGLRLELTVRIPPSYP